MADLKMFGYELKKQPPEEPVGQSQDKSFVPKDEVDDAGSHIHYNEAGHYGYTMNFDGNEFATEGERILNYRQVSTQPECDAAIEHIVNDAIITDHLGQSVKLRLDNVNASEAIKSTITAEFNNVLNLMNFSRKGHDIFKQWYVDGRYPYHVIVDSKNPQKGIKELRYIDPVKLRKVKDVTTEKDPRSGAKVIKSTQTYYVYTDSSISNHDTDGNKSGVRINKDAVIYATSGQLDPSRRFVVSYLDKAVRSVNLLRMMEDAVVIYRISRAPERRVFYIDVGNLPKSKAEAYVQSIMQKYRNKMVYDTNTGEVKDATRHQSMMEDFFLPRREGGRGTEVDTLAGGTNLGEIDDIEYFQKKLYRALNVPYSRLHQASETAYTIGGSGDINRDEIAFSKFIDKVRIQFSKLFLHAIKIQLLSKGVINSSDWEAWKNQIIFDFLEDNYYSELKETEIWQGRFEMLTTLDEYIGTHVSNEWVQKNVLRFSDDEIAREKARIKKERAAGELEVPDGDDPRWDNNPT